MSRRRLQETQQDLLLTLWSVEVGQLAKSVHPG